MVKHNDYEKKRKEQIENGAKGKKLLLHACCAPCLTACIERLVNDFSVTVYFYNPNMDSKEEYDKRLNELKRFLSEAYGDDVGLIYEEYDADEYYNAVKGYEQCKEGGTRCEKCFRLRLEKTAEVALMRGFDYFTTTLTVSPYKNAVLLNETGERIAKEVNVGWLYADFKKANGYLRSIELSREYNLYRQNYCGCVFSAESEKKHKVSL